MFSIFAIFLDYLQLQYSWKCWNWHWVDFKIDKRKGQKGFRSKSWRMSWQDAGCNRSLHCRTCKLALVLKLALALELIKERVQKIAEANPGACLGKMQRVIGAYIAGPASWHCPRKITLMHFNSTIGPQTWCQKFTEISFVLFVTCMFSMYRVLLDRH